MDLLNNLCRVRPRVKASPHALPATGVERRGVSLGDALQAEGELGSDAASSLGIQGESLPVDVGEVVAGLVVARVHGRSRSGEDTRGWDAELEESDIVGGRSEPTAHGKLRLAKQGLTCLPIVGILALGLQILDQRSTPDLVGIGVSVDSVDWLDGAYHVVVEVKADLVGLLGGELRAIVQGSK